jgi:hypothetical protein
VTADTPKDGEQIALIRQHLQDEAEKLRRADFGDPATIHGHDMPGLAERVPPRRVREDRPQADERFDGCGLADTAQVTNDAFRCGLFNLRQERAVRVTG